MCKIGVLLFTLQIASLTAIPQGAQVIEGSAEMTSLPNGLEVRSQNGSIIQWSDFSIEQGELTRFVQESSKSAVFNRVTSNIPSTISGVLESNGRVFLINPNGIVVTKEGLINTAGFLASTLDFNIQDYMDGNETAFQGKGSVVNLGKITVTEGDIFLFGMQVENQGTLEAPSGAVRISAAQKMLISPDKNIYITVTPSSFKKELLFQMRD